MSGASGKASPERQPGGDEVVVPTSGPTPPRSIEHPRRPADRAVRHAQIIAAYVHGVPHDTVLYALKKMEENDV